MRGWPSIIPGIIGQRATQDGMCTQSPRRTNHAHCRAGAAVMMDTEITSDENYLCSPPSFANGDLGCLDQLEKEHRELKRAYFELSLRQGDGIGGGLDVSASLLAGTDQETRRERTLSEPEEPSTQDGQAPPSETLLPRPGPHTAHSSPSQPGFCCVMPGEAGVGLWRSVTNACG